MQPIISFYNTPLSALHKVLAHYLKRISNNHVRIKTTTEFKHHFTCTGHPDFPYHATMDIQSLYTSCDMKLAITTTI